MIWLRDKSSSGGGGLMRGIKIPQQDFALKMLGGVFAGHYGTYVATFWSSKYFHTFHDKFISSGWQVDRSIWCEKQEADPHNISNIPF